MVRSVGSNSPLQLIIKDFEKTARSQFNASVIRTKNAVSEAFKLHSQGLNKSYSSQMTFKTSLSASYEQPFAYLLKNFQGHENISEIRDLIELFSSHNGVLKGVRILKKPTQSQPEAMIFQQPKTLEKMLSQAEKGRPMVFETPKGRIIAPKSAELPKTITTVADGVKKTHKSNKVIRIDDEVFHAVKDAVVSFARYEIAKSAAKPEDKKAKEEKVDSKKVKNADVEPKEIRKNSNEKTQTQESLKAKAEIEQKLQQERLMDHFFENLRGRKVG